MAASVEIFRHACISMLKKHKLQLVASVSKRFVISQFFLILFTDSALQLHLLQVLFKFSSSVQEILTQITETFVSTFSVISIKIYTSVWYSWKLQVHKIKR